MTGFGKAIVGTTQKKISFEIKSLNSKQLDLNIKLPWLYKDKESEIRNLIGKRLDRGKIDAAIFVDTINEETVPIINKAVVKNYYNQLGEIAWEYGLQLDNTVLDTIMRLPDALKTDRQELDDEEWKLVMDILEEALEQIEKYRVEEGAAIETDFRRGISVISGLLDEVAALDGARIERIRTRMGNSLSEFLANNTIDKNRFEQELIYYIEKLDINEERVRLKKHLDYFLEKLEEPSPNGKILNFISQEMGREINTIGSKANDADIQKLVVMMKDELEKIKEQTLNVL
jgi:uncharacterized protein (TIGR00255 family)